MLGFKAYATTAGVSSLFSYFRYLLKVPWHHQVYSQNLILSIAPHLCWFSRLPQFLAVSRCNTHADWLGTALAWPGLLLLSVYKMTRFLLFSTLGSTCWSCSAPKQKVLLLFKVHFYEATAGSNLQNWRRTFLFSLWETRVFLRQSVYPWLARNWPQTCSDAPASASWVLRLQTCATMLSLGLFFL